MMKMMFGLRVSPAWSAPVQEQAMKKTAKMPMKRCMEGLLVRYSINGEASTAISAGRNGAASAGFAAASKEWLLQRRSFLARFLFFQTLGVRRTGDVHDIIDDHVGEPSHI